MSEGKHTEVPWAVFNGTDIFPDDGCEEARRHIANFDPQGAPVDHDPEHPRTDLSLGECMANAAFIVKAANAHEGLMEALRNCAAVLDEAGRDALARDLTNEELGRLWNMTVEQARTALDQAEEG